MFSSSLQTLKTEIFSPFTESQNHRTGEVGKDLWSLSSSRPPPLQVSRLHSILSPGGKGLQLLKASPSGKE